MRADTRNETGFGDQTSHDTVQSSYHKEISQSKCRAMDERPDRAPLRPSENLVESAERDRSLRRASDRRWRSEEESVTEPEENDIEDETGEFPRNSVLVRGREYSLALVSTPVQCTTSSHGLCEPVLIAELVVRDDHPEKTTHAALPGEEDLPYLLATVSLWDAAGMTQVVPAKSASHVRGKMVANGEVHRDEQGQSKIYFIFPGLQITQSGSWRLGVSLMGLWPGSTQGVDGSGTVIVGVKADIRTNAVPENSPLAIGRVQIDSRTEALLSTLREQGVELEGSERSSQSRGSHSS